MCKCATILMVILCRAAVAKSTSGATTFYQHNPYGANTYAFGFEVNDTRTGNVQFRDERRYSNGEVVGSYGFVRADGRLMVTRFRAHPQRGYASESNTYAQQDADKWHKLWPTKRPAILVDRPPALPLNVTYNAADHLNVTHGPVQHTDSSEALSVPATVADIVNGRIPLYAEPSGDAANGERRVGFKMIEGQKFVPPEFPLVHFLMPMHTTQQKQERAKENNNEKALPKRFTKPGTEKMMAAHWPLPLPLDA